MTAVPLPAHATRALEAWRDAGQRVVFTNGVFDLLHRGHVEYLEEARALGDRLVVGVNSDASVRRLKGAERPLVPEAERVELLGALAAVDLALVFTDDTPLDLIEAVRPDVLVKGGDWAVDQIVGRAFVESYGGRVLNVPLREGLSTTALVERVRAGRGALDP
ncbi:MAG TPA: D-glycero-beta-D-manno-heptose 1-phosphate adenylyltransferase [Candidatus Saccharimonadaceae bacterium]|nr:D-glycero-beta-D-manno-heptose 1-phosphate adenylyltransferase [Candidatus Saccharimonadaceae bacterium]